MKGAALTTLRAILPGLMAILLSASASAQDPSPPDRLSVMTVPRSMAPTLMQIAPDTDETYTPYGIGVPYPSCYRMRRCSAYDVYNFRDRPNRLTRLAPEAPTEADASDGSVSYVWLFVPVTPEESIVPKYRTASQVREEHRDVGKPIGGSSK